MRERVIFLESVVSEDSSGGYTSDTYTEVYECWANVVVDNSQRDYTNFQYSNMTRANVTIRYNPNFTPEISNKLAWRGKLLTIHSSPDIGAKDYIELVCYYDPKIDYESTS
jgi:head-tail adaptor